MSRPSPWAALEAARYQAEQLGNLARARELTAAARVATTDPEARYHLDALLDWLARRARRRAVAGAAADEAGQVACLLCDVDCSGEGFVATLCATSAEGGAGMPPRSGAAFAEAIEEAELALLRYLRQRHRLEPRGALLRGRRYAVRGPRAATSYVKDGGSIGAAAALALYSLVTDTPVPRGLLVSGRVAADGALQAVGAIEQKVRAALRERPEVTAVLVPAASYRALPSTLCDPRVRGVADLQQLLVASFGEEAAHSAPARAVDIEGSVAQGIALYEKRNDFAAAREVLEQALGAIAQRRQQAADGSLYRREELLCRWRIGSCLTHAGDVEGAAEWLSGAQTLGDALWEREELDPQAYLGFRGNLAVLLRDTFAYAAAERTLRETLALQQALRQGKRERAKLLGNLGELLTFSDRFDEAEALLLEALEHLRATYVDEVPRALCLLGNLELLRGRPDAAAARYREGLAANREVTHGHDRNAAFLRYGLVRALHRQGRHEQAIAEADRALAGADPGQPYPRQLVLQQRGLARLAEGDAARGAADLLAAADTTHVRGSLLRFGVSTALGRLAAHELRGAPEPPQRARIAGWIEALAAAAAALPGLPEGARLVRELRERSGRFVAHGAEGEALAALLEQLAATFPY